MIATMCWQLSMRKSNRGNETNDENKTKDIAKLGVHWSLDRKEEKN